MSIGENIKKKRTERGISQCELGERVHITQSMVAQIERGSKIPTLILGKEIAMALECGVEELLKE